MADPLTLTVLGTIAATEGIKFLYGQASEVLRAWRERRQQGADLEVPFLETEVLDGSPAGSVVNIDVVTAQRERLISSISALHPYAAGLEDIDTDDENLARAAGDLRALLEAAYGQRLTFVGEERERTGARVDVRQVLGSVSGRAVGAEADVVDGELSVSQRADEVTLDGSVIGFKGRLGS